MPTTDTLTFAFAVDETDFEEMVSYPTSVTGVDNTIFISPKGNARHGPRIKVAINPPDRIDPRSETASVDFDGTIVSGTSVESYTSWAVWVDRSTDNGKTWTKFGPITVAPGPAPGAPGGKEHTSGIIQPSVVSLGKKHLRLYARSTSDISRICAADSFDNGVTWTQAHLLDLPNPNSGIDAVGLRDGRIVLIYNDTTKGRTPLNLAISSDGEHFKMFSTLEDEPGEYSYPAIIQGKNGDLLMTWTWDRKRIRFAHLPTSCYT